MLDLQFDVFGESEHQIARFLIVQSFHHDVAAELLVEL